jgi:hypothetical protein
MALGDASLSGAKYSRDLRIGFEITGCGQIGGEIFFFRCILEN